LAVGSSNPTGVVESTIQRRNKLRSIKLCPLAGLVALLQLHFTVSSNAQLPPNAPQPEQRTTSADNPPATKVQTESPCQIKRDGTAFLQAAVAGAASYDSPTPPLDRNLAPAPCPPLAPLIDWYARFLTGPQVKPLTPKEKGLLAVRNLADPFNAITIAGNSAIYIGANSHSAYGPGMSGFGKNVGISYAEDGISEFFGTFLIPSIAHQDPHYHRMPEASLSHRFTHSLTQVVWTQGDDGHGMLNYANLVGFAIDGQLVNLYVPGVHTNARATTSRYLIALGTAPAENLITEFLPDVARHVHLHVVVVQRIIDQISRSDAGQ
jgi:hypothetical protein